MGTRRRATCKRSAFAGLGCFVLLLLASAALGQADPWPEVVSRARASLIFIRVQCTGQSQMGSLSGTGFLLRRSGYRYRYVVTNNHVVTCPEGLVASPPELLHVANPAQPSGGLDVVGAAIVDRDPVNDLALLRIGRMAGLLFTLDETGLTFSRVRGVQEEVMAGGFPLALPGEPSWTRGHVSAIDRVLPNRPTRFVQIDVAVNPGNSGGPLLNANGEVVGVIVAQARAPEGGGAAEGINFAIAADIAQHFVDSTLLPELLRVPGAARRP
jgi:serine protease Do